MKLFSDDVTPILSAENIFSTLVSLEVESHLLHLNTTSFAQHKALDELYSGIQGFRDTILENVLGHTNKRLMPVKGIAVKTGRTEQEICSELNMFSKQLHSWGEDNDWDDLANIADELQALSTKVSYLLTLS
jgi:hypothetical protein